MNEVITIGVDLAKNVFQVHGVDTAGETVIRRQLRRHAEPELRGTCALRLRGGDQAGRGDSQQQRSQPAPGGEL